eukprot:4250423-Prymnesium_polylepis.1
MPPWAAPRAEEAATRAPRQERTEAGQTERNARRADRARAALYDEVIRRDEQELRCVHEEGDEGVATLAA